MEFPVSASKPLRIEDEKTDTFDLFSLFACCLRF